MTETKPQHDEMKPEPIASKRQTPMSAATESDDTIGTGTAMALGCVSGTVLLIVFGLLFLFFSTLR